MPILFIYIIIIYSQSNPNFINKAISISINSFFIVSIFSLLNLFGIINFHSSLPELEPTLTIIKNNLVINIERSSIFFITLPRLNLLTGGALGSSAAIFVTLAIVTILHDSFSKIYKIFVFLFLTFTALLTVSASIATPVFFLFLFYLLFRYKKVLKFIIFFAGLITILIAYLFFKFNPLEYFSSTIIKSFVGYFRLMTIQDFLFGIGPRITTNGYEYINTNKFFMIDVGLLRVFVETGFINLVIFLFFISNIFKKGIRIIKFKFEDSNLKYILLFTVLCFLVHANFSILPPFYPLFAISVSAILINYNKYFKEKYLYV
jgi:hypothetical protein